MRSLAVPVLLSLWAAAALAPALAQPSAADLPAIVEEVPFITSPDNVTLEMLGAARVGPRDHVIDLGSGDGRIVITAARRFGASGLGVEIVPELVQQSLKSARDAGVAERVDFRVQDLFATDLSRATVITMYLLPEFNLRLRPALLKLAPGTRVVSHDWDMGDWKPERTSEVAVPDKKVGLAKSSKIHLWTVPADIEGLWCGAGLLRGGSFRLAQKFQEFSGTLSWRNRDRAIEGRIDGATVHMQAGRHGALELRADGDRLTLVAAEGELAIARGVSFTRTRGAQCPA